MSQLHGLYLGNLKYLPTLPFIHMDVWRKEHTLNRLSRHMQLPWSLVRSIDWTCYVCIPILDSQKKWWQHFGLLVSNIIKIIILLTALLLSASSSCIALLLSTISVCIALLLSTSSTCIAAVLLSTNSPCWAATNSL